MARIKLIVTGDMEKLALHTSLQQVFPGERDGEEVIWDKPRKSQCVTSHQLQLERSPSHPMRELAKAMIAEAGIGKTGTPADLVIVIDDVELGNLGQETIIATHFRIAVEEELRKYNTATETRYRNIIREKCSFHLLKPMVEAYLFGDPNALRIAGVPTGINHCLVHPSDVEQFQTYDTEWLPACYAENVKKQQNTPWWRHEYHPKHYIEHLTERGQVFYEETHHGKNALMQLNWNKVPKCQPDTPIIRSLFEDISDWFGIQNPISGATHPAFYPTKAVNRESLLLRNM